MFACLFASLVDTNVCVVCDVSYDAVCACMCSIVVCIGVCGLKTFVCLFVIQVVILHGMCLFSACVLVCVCVC